MSQDVEVVFKEAFLQIRHVAQGEPGGLGRIIPTLHRRPGQRIGQREVMRMRDGAPALAAVRVVEYGDLLQRGTPGDLGQGAVGFFRQFAQARLPECVVRLQESAGQGPQPFARGVGAADQQDMVLAAHDGIHGDEDRRVGRACPGGAVAAQHLPFLLQCQIVWLAGELRQQRLRRRGNVGSEGGERGGDGPGRGTEIGVADRGGVDAALALHADQCPAGKGVQVIAAGILEVAHEADARLRRGVVRHGLTHGLGPGGLVVAVAHGQHGQACGILRGQGVAQHGRALFPSEWVLGGARLVG